MQNRQNQWPESAISIVGEWHFGWKAFLGYIFIFGLVLEYCDQFTEYRLKSSTGSIIEFRPTGATIPCGIAETWSLPINIVNLSSLHCLQTISSSVLCLQIEFEFRQARHLSALEAFFRTSRRSDKRVHNKSPSANFYLGSRTFSNGSVIELRGKPQGGTATEMAVTFESRTKFLYFDFFSNVINLSDRSTINYTIWWGFQRKIRIVMRKNMQTIHVFFLCIKKNETRPEHRAWTSSPEQTFIT